MEKTAEIPEGFKMTEIGLLPEDWEVARLGHVAELQQGKTPCRDDYDDYRGFRIIKVKDFENGNVVSFKISGDRSFVRVDLGDRYLLKKGDVLVLSAAHSPNIVGQKIGFVDNIPYGKAFFVAELLRARSNIEKIHPYFCFLILNLEKSKKQIKEEVKGGHLYPRNLKNIKIPLPPLSEQHQIADILSAIDNKIEAEESKKQALDTLFKTLLSLLMTGKIRVKDLEV